MSPNVLVVCFVFCRVFHCMAIAPFSIYSPVGEHLSCFEFLPVVIGAAVNIDV